MKIKEIIREYNELDEAPLQDYVPLGDFSKPGPFKDPEHKLIGHPVHMTKTERFFSASPQNWRFFFSNQPRQRQHRESGVATPEAIKNIFGNDADAILKDSGDAITVVFLGNYGDAKVLLTPWTIAHRVGHAIAASDRRSSVRQDQTPWRDAERIFFDWANTVLRTWYSAASIVRWSLTPQYNALFNAIGIQRSSRESKIRRPYEFLYELFSQYILRGKIEFRDPPRSVGYGQKAWGKHTRYMNLQRSDNPEAQMHGIRTSMERLARNLESAFAEVLSDATGKIYLM